MLECVIVPQEGAVGLCAVLGDKLLVGGQLLIQSFLLRLDLLDEPDHGGVVCGHDMGQRQQMDICQGAPDPLQLPLTDHVLIHNDTRVAVDIIDAENSQDIGQQRHQPQ